MFLNALEIRNLRIISAADLSPSPHLNLLFGVNAAGKTSVLEAIDFLSRGSSFRSRRVSELMRSNAAEILVAGNCVTGKTDRRLGISRSGRDTVMRVQGESVASLAEYAIHLPVRCIHPDSQDLVQGTPALRRAFMDWGLFHVEQGFYDAWKRYQRGLEQRNSALRVNSQSAMDWDHLVAEQGERVSEWRQYYVNALSEAVYRQASQLMGKEALTLHYISGWDEGQPLINALKANRDRDFARGYTTVGPHRADLDINWGEQAAAKVASRGQLKLIATAMYLGQAEHYCAIKNEKVIMIVDELPAELDERARSCFMKALRELEVQVFVSAINPEQLDRQDWPAAKLFHVEQGRVSEML